MIGPSVSGLFLWIIGILNLVALRGNIKVFQNCARAATLARQRRDGRVWFCSGGQRRRGPAQYAGGRIHL